MKSAFNIITGDLVVRDGESILFQDNLDPPPNQISIKLHYVDLILLCHGFVVQGEWVLKCNTWHRSVTKRFDPSTRWQVWISDDGTVHLRFKDRSVAFQTNLLTSKDADEWLDLLGWNRISDWSDCMSGGYGWKQADIERQCHG